MELKYLHTFRTVVETGSFAKAAQQLNYTQLPSPSRWDSWSGSWQFPSLKSWGAACL